MIARLIGTPMRALVASLLGAGSLAGAAALLLPGGADLASATRRAAASFAPPPRPAAVPAGASLTPADLAIRFSQGQSLSLPQLRWLLAAGTATQDAPMLLAVAARLESHEPVPTARVAWDLLASGRPAVARAFLDGRPDGHDPALWQLRFDLARRTGDLAAARAMVEEAATHPGTAPPGQLIAAALAANLPETIVTAAERRAIPAPDPNLSRDLVHRALAAGRPDLIARIDRAGTPTWREADPWLAMDLARQAGNIPLALHYAALLPSGRDEARRALVIASGDRAAIRAMLIDQASAGTNRPAIAQQLLEAGYRSDAIALLQAESTGRPASDPVSARLLYLMGPRPDAVGLQWLRSRAANAPDWRAAYLERERPAVALAFLSGQNDTPALLQRLHLAAAARDRSAAAGLLGQVLDGRRLTSTEIAAIAANLLPGMDNRWTIALARARLQAQVATPQDWRDLAWDAAQHGRTGEAESLLARYLGQAPQDRAALRLMAEIARKRGGETASRQWLERALAQTASASLERAELLEQLHRPAEALPIAAQLRAAAPADAHLAALNARLLIAAGEPGRARKVLKP